MNVAEGVYRRAALAEAWRLASLIDRNPWSRTRGSFSRTHWAWKFDDFPYPRMQEGIFALVCLHDLEVDDNPFFQSESAAQWVEWCFEYWTTLQHENGSFDEAYPFEQCLAATAFTTFYIGSAFLRWGPRLPQELHGRVIESFRKAGQWLCQNDETHGVLSNHLAAAVAALEVLARICEQEKFSARAKFFLERILAHQSSEGWMREYDGADIGYGTHGFFYLAHYWRMTGCTETLEALKRFAGFLVYFVHPDGTMGGEYSSRNTEFYFPAGFEILAGHCPHSRAIALSMRKALDEKRPCGLWAMDSFNFFPMLNNLFFAAESAQPRENFDALPWQHRPFSTYFGESGLWIVNRDKYYAIVALSKGGTVCVFDKLERRIAARHAGHFLTWHGRVFTSQDYMLKPVVSWEPDGNKVTFSVPWKSTSRMNFTPLLFLGFRMFTLTLGRFPTVSRWVKLFLVNLLIRRKKRPPLLHSRSIRLTNDGVAIEDRMELPDGVTGLAAAAQFTSIHMGSSMYCDIRAVHGSSSLQEIACSDSRQLRLTGLLTLSGNRWQRNTG